MAKMLKSLPTRPATASLRIVLLVGLSVLLIQPGCLFRKRAAPAAPQLPAPIRVAFLPLNVPQGTPDLHWIAVAAAIVAADTALAAPDLEPAPLWESIPAALQSLGNSRTVAREVSEMTGARLSAKWTTEGEVRSEKDGTIIRLDFTPSNPSIIPFRYEKPLVLDRIGIQFCDAFDQFLRHLIVRPIQQDKIAAWDLKRLRAIAEAVDLEYGWFTTSAKPGAAGEVVEDLARTDLPLAKLLFSATLYPALAK
jgi:hypothetical protein